MLLWKARKPIYRWMGRGGHRAEGDDQTWAERTEVHHRPGDGFREAMVRGPLEALGFEVNLYPHKHRVGAGVVNGERGRAVDKIRWAQRLSGIDPESREGVLSVMVVATRL